MGLYGALARLGFQRMTAYRLAALSGASTNLFWGMLRAYVFVALYETRPVAGGYTLTDALTFTFLTQGIAPLCELFTWWRIAEGVRTGEVATDLARPFDYELYWLAQDYGRAAFQFLFRFLPMLVFGALVFDLRHPAPWLWPAVLLSLLLAVTLSFAYRFIANLSAFWLLDYRGVAGLGGFAVLFFSGFIAPLVLFPDGLREVLYLLPFASLVAIPVDVYLGKAAGWGLAGALALQAFWAAAGLLLGRWVLRAALRKLVVQGG